MIFFSSFQLEAIFVRVFITNTPSQKGSQRGSGEVGRRKFRGRHRPGECWVATVFAQGTLSSACLSLEAQGET